VRERRLQVAQLLRAEPAARRERGLFQTFYSLLADRDLEDAEAVEGDAYTDPVGQEINIGRVSIARGHPKMVGGPGSPFD
jgi:hypothetical protein